VLPIDGADTASLPVESRRRNPWTWPLVALVSLLAVVLIGTIIALLANPGPGEDPSATETGSQSPTPSTTPTGNDRVPLDEADIIGRTEPVVEAFLLDLGLALDAQVGIVAPSEDQVGLAYSANPHGNVRVGEIITVKFYAPIPPPVASKPTAVTAPAGPWLAGDIITVTWPAYGGCPAGHPLSGFNFQVDNGSISGDNNPIDASATSVDIQLSSTAGETTTIKYTALCTDFESPASDPTGVTVN
jgi:serine/threonine-protein kinase